MGSNMPKRTVPSDTIEQEFSKGAPFDRTNHLKVFIVGDSHIVRSGLRRILERESAIHIIGDGTVHQANIETLSYPAPDVVLIDLDSRGADALGLIGSLHNSSANLHILIMIELADVELAQEALTLGASGIVLKVQPPSVLVAAIRELCQANANRLVMQRGAGTSEKLRTGNVNLSSDASAMPKVHTLTAREREIIRLLGLGLKNKDIANRLSISDITVRHHLTSIFIKLEVEDRQKLLILAHRYGLADLSGSGESA
jgi:DNA-binding NarL/FixJ family response regulator